MLVIVSNAVNPVNLQTHDAAQRLLRTFFNIAGRWRLTVDQEMRILGVNRSTCMSWRTGVVTTGLDPSTLERLSYVIRIFGALQILLPIPERADAWLTAPNQAPIFEGGSALQKMLSDGLQAVADYLDSQLTFGSEFPQSRQWSTASA